MSGNRFAALSEGDFGPNEPGPSTETTEGVSHSYTRPASPTPGLQPAYVAPGYAMAGVDYDTLAAAIAGRGHEYNMSNVFVQWQQEIGELTQRDVKNAYNILASKMYEHKHALDIADHQLTLKYLELKADVVMNEKSSDSTFK